MTVRAFLLLAHRFTGIVLALYVLLVACLAGCRDRATAVSEAHDRATITVVDAEKRQVTVRVPVRRAAVFNAFNVELIRAIGAMSAVVGMDEDTAGRNYEGYWPGFDLTRTIGRGQGEPNWEQIVALSPDVVILPRNGALREAQRVLAPFHIPVVVLTGWDLEEHELTVTTLGRLFNRQAEADRLKAFYAKYRAVLVERLRGVTPVSVFLENQRSFSSPIPGSGWHDMITMAGGRNIFTDTKLRSGDESQGSVHDVPIDPEAVLDRRPDFIVKLTGGGYAPQSGDGRAAVAASLSARAGWDRLAAVKEGRVRVTSSYPMNACTKIVGALYLAQWLHPDRMSGIDPDAVMRQWVEEFQHVRLPDPTVYRR